LYFAGVFKEAFEHFYLVIADLFLKYRWSSFFSAIQSTTIIFFSLLILMLEVGTLSFYRMSLRAIQRFAAFRNLLNSTVVYIPTICNPIFWTMLDI